MGWVHCGAWTPDGEYYVFQSTRNGITNVWAICEHGGFFRKVNRQPTVLTSGPMNYLGPMPSKDGRKLFVIGEQPRGELVRYDSKTRQFVPYLSGISAEAVNFSRDGAWVAYVAYPDGTLWRSKVDGSHRLQLIFPPMRAFQLRWSPDAKQIAFMATMPGKRWQIYLISAEGGSPRQLTKDERNYADPDWSADGSSLVFGAIPFLEPYQATGIYILDLRAGQSARMLSGSEGLYAPRWSPDGRYVAAVTTDNQTLLRFDLMTEKWVTWAKINPSYYDWSRDSKYVYFDSPDGGEPSFYRLGISDQKPKHLTSMSGLGRLASGTAGVWTGIAPDNSPLVLRDTGSQEIYFLDWDAR